MDKRAILLLAVAALCGCHWNRPKADQPYQTVAGDPRRDTARARGETARGTSLLEAGNLPEAEKAFKAALSADLFHGPAHNSLGIVYYRQKRFYLAAWEFQYAARLMGNRPEPKNNLGIVFEAVGKLQEAEAHYAQALQMQPDNPEFLGNLARCRIRQKKRDGQTRKLLEDLLLKDTRPEWIEWARKELMSTPREPTPPPTTQPATSAHEPIPAPPE